MKILKNQIYTIAILLIPLFGVKAQHLKGVVYGTSETKANLLTGANVYWLNTTIGAATDAKGEFQISMDAVSKKLVISFLGYQNDTLAIKEQTFVKVILKEKKDTELQTVKIVAERDASFISSQPIKTEILLQKELQKAACCNLGESFETNASVDVSYKDAISGSKELQVLGLSGSYTQILTENAPLINGLGLTYGLNSIPGSLIDQIHIVKGPASVIFGPESISGMINVDLKDPAKAEKIFINAYLDDDVRKELNVDKGIRINDRLSSLFSFHVDQTADKFDFNKDGFMDVPLLTNVNMLNKWKFNNQKGLISQNTIKYLQEERMSGETKFDFKRDFADSSAYGQKLHTKRLELYGRIGYVIPASSYHSLGLQYNVVGHKQNGFYGFKQYTGEQKDAYLRLVYNAHLDKYNSLNAGFSAKYTLINETFDGNLYDKKEVVPGVFMENTFKKINLPVLITGVRLDRFNGKFYVTPRANLKYSPTEKTDIRLTAGSAFKTADILAENPAILASSRKIFVKEKLDPERAFNTGINIEQHFKLNYRQGNIGLDLYRTIFSNKIIPDFDTDPGKVMFSNLDGRYYSNNLQLEVSYELVKKLQLKIAYKYLDLYRLNNMIRYQEPFISKNRLLVNLSYESFNRKWKANTTMQWHGKKKLPQTVHHPQDLKRSPYSSPYAVYNMQLTRVLKNFEFYMGSENILNFIQKDPIMSADQPYGPYFDTMFMWGPMTGRKIYAGFRSMSFS